jgi:hypothetical protein
LVPPQPGETGRGAQLLRLRLLRARARSIARRYEASARSGALGFRRRSKSPIDRWTSGPHDASLPVRSTCTTAAFECRQRFIGIPLFFEAFRKSDMP